MTSSVLKDTDLLLINRNEGTQLQPNWKPYSVSFEKLSKEIGDSVDIPAIGYTSNISNVNSTPEGRVRFTTTNTDDYALVTEFVFSNVQRDVLKLSTGEEIEIYNIEQTNSAEYTIDSDPVDDGTHIKVSVTHKTGTSDPGDKFVEGDEVKFRSLTVITGGGGSINIGPTPPTLKPGDVYEDGTLWFNSSNGITYIWYVDLANNNDKGQWVDVRPGGGGSGSDGVPGQDGAPGNPTNGDLWVDTSICPPELKIWVDEAECPGEGGWNPVEGGGVKPIEPDVIDISGPISGSGTIGEPFLFTDSTTIIGGSTITNEELTISNQTPGGVVEFDVYSVTVTGETENKFEQPVGVVGPDGTFKTNLVFNDIPESDIPKDYTALIKIGDLYLEWKVIVTPDISPPVLKTVTLENTGTDPNKRFDDQSFKTTLDLDEGSPISTKSIAYKVAGTITRDVNTDVIASVTEVNSTSTDLILSGNKDLDVFEVGDAVSQDSSGTPVTTTIRSVTPVDGSWKPITGVTNSNEFNDVFYGGSSSSNSYYVSMTYYSSKTQIIKSRDGMAFESAGNTPTFMNAGAYGNGRFVMVGNSGQNNVVYATTPGSWTTTTVNTSNGAAVGGFNSITFGKDKFVAVGSGSYIMYSATGVADSWTVVENNPTINSATWFSIVYGAGKYVAVGGQKMMTSTNGTTSWSAVTSSDISSANWSGVAYGNNKFVAVSSNSPTILYSTNGTTWYPATAPVARAAASYYAVAFGDGKFVATCKSGNYKTISSTDGITWVGQKNSLSGKGMAITYGKDKFVMCGTFGSIPLQYSTDGTGATVMNLTLNNNTNIANLRVGDAVTETGSDGTGTITNIEGNTLTLNPYGGNWGISTITGPTIPAATGTITSITNSKMTLSSSNGRWLVTQSNYDTDKKLNKTAFIRKTIDNAMVYLDTDGDRNVTGTSSVPVYHNTTAITDEITFDQPPNTGKTWDEELPDGITIQSEAYADNTIGGGGRSPENGSMESNLVDPGSTVVRNLTQEEVDATKLLFQTKAYRQEKYKQDLVARGAELRTSLEAQGYTTAEIDDVLN